MPVDRLYVEAEVANTPAVEEMIRRVGAAETVIVQDGQPVYDAVLRAKDPAGVDRAAARIVSYLRERQLVPGR